MFVSRAPEGSHVLEEGESAADYALTLIQMAIGQVDADITGRDDVLEGVNVQLNLIHDTFNLDTRPAANLG